MNNFSIKQKHFKFFLYFVVVILVNIVGITLFFRMDLTQSKMYSLSPASNEVVSTLSEPLSIKVFFSKNLPAPHNNTERYLRDLLEEYSSKGGQYFNYKFYDVSPEQGLGGKADENRDTARDYGIQPIQIRIRSRNRLAEGRRKTGSQPLDIDLHHKALGRGQPCWPRSAPVPCRIEAGQSRPA